MEDFGRDRWDPMVSVNLTAAFELAYEASKFMIGQRSGKIINIASLFSFLGGRRSPAYAATKAGLVGFTKAYCDRPQKGVVMSGILPDELVMTSYFSVRDNQIVSLTVILNQPSHY